MGFSSWDILSHYTKILITLLQKVINKKLLTWFSVEQELVFMTSKTILRGSMIMVI